MVHNTTASENEQRPEAVAADALGPVPKTINAAWHTNPRKQRVVARLRGRDGDLCFYCGKLMRFPFDAKPAEARKATVEHLIDYQRGGTMHHFNAVLAHDKCNSSRAQMKTVAEKIASRSPDAPPIALAVLKTVAAPAKTEAAMNAVRERDGTQFRRPRALLSVGSANAAREHADEPNGTNPNPSTRDLMEGR